MTCKPSFDHRASIVAYLDQKAAEHEASDDDFARRHASFLRAIGSSIVAQLDMEPGERSLGSPVDAVLRLVPNDTEHALLAQTWLVNDLINWSKERLTEAMGFESEVIFNSTLASATQLRETDQQFRALTDRLRQQELRCAHCGEPFINF